MLIVISDLHFQDTASYARYQGPDQEDRRNVGPRAFALFFHALADQAKRLVHKNPGWDGEIRIVLAGDILELARSLQWFRRPRVRPYVDAPVEAGSDLDDRVRLIYEGIKASDANGATFDLLRGMLDWQATPGWADEFPAATRITYEYLPGNHDRIVNLCPSVNEQFRKDFGLGGGPGLKPFPHVLRCPEYGVFVRHGHEYDELNCEFVIGSDAPRGARDQKLYDATPFGDFMTTEFAGQLVHKYYRLALEGEFEDIPVGSEAYHRAIGILQAFDDVRPQASVFDWLRQAAPGDGSSPNLWPSIQRTLSATLRSLGACREFKDWLEARDKKWVPDRIDAIQLALRAPETFLVWLAERILPGGKADETIAHNRIVEDPEWGNPRFRYAAVGHWHQAQNVPLRTRFGQVNHALCSGTWRSRYTKCEHDDTFAASQTMNYLLFFRAEELAAIGGGTGGRVVVSAADTVQMQRFVARGEPAAPGKGRYLVRFTRIDILDDTDPAGSGELFFKGIVNSQTTGLRGQFDWYEGTFEIDWEVEVVLTEGMDLVVGFKGYDEDWPSPDDRLGDVSVMYTPEDRESWPALRPAPRVLRRERGVESDNGKMRVSWEVIGRTWS